VSDVLSWPIMWIRLSNFGPQAVSSIVPLNFQSDLRHCYRVIVHFSPFSSRLALHLLHVGVDWHMNGDVGQRLGDGQRAAVVRVVESEVGSLWTELPETAKLQRNRVQSVCMPRSNLRQHTAPSHRHRLYRVMFFSTEIATCCDIILVFFN